MANLGYDGTSVNVAAEHDSTSNVAPDDDVEEQGDIQQVKLGKRVKNLFS